MNQPVITIVTVNCNSADFVINMLDSFRALTFNPYKVIIRDNKSKLRDFLHLKTSISRFDNVELYRVETNLKGSMDHGEGLNDLVQKIDTPYGVIMDADAVFLRKGWDAVLISQLSDSIPIIGTQADVGGGKPEDFPLMFAVLFKTEILRNLSIDFRPLDISRFQDTGWELREKYLAKGFSGKLLYDFNTRNYKKGPFADIPCSEYYLSPEGVGLIASHFGRGSAPTAKKLAKITGRSFLSRIVNRALLPLNAYLWGRDKKRWIKVCRAIIDTVSQ